MGQQQVAPVRWRQRLAARWRAAGAALALLGATPVVGMAHTDDVLVSVVPPLPRLGAVQTVDRNDVGDPFILAVPAGTPPPPPTSTAPAHGHRPLWTSVPWTASDVATARSKGWYVLFATTDWQSHVPAAVSTDLTHWSAAPDALPSLPTWARPTVSMTWGPAAQRSATGGWVLYFSTEDRATHHECIGAATAAYPAGPYRDSDPAPLVCQAAQGGSIDPSVVHGPSDRNWLVWKNDGNSSKLPDTLWSAPLSPDGLHLTAGPSALLTAADAWDGGIIEAPAMLAATGGGWWLFYAAGGWDTDRYATGLAFCPSVSGPCLPSSAQPFLRTTKAMISPGTLDTVTAHDGQVWAAWSALQPERAPWSRGRTWYDRVLEIAPVLHR